MQSRTRKWPKNTKFRICYSFLVCVSLLICFSLYIISFLLASTHTTKCSRTGISFCISELWTPRILKIMQMELNPPPPQHSARGWIGRKFLTPQSNIQNGCNLKANVDVIIMININLFWLCWWYTDCVFVRIQDCFLFFIPKPSRIEYH